MSGSIEKSRYGCNLQGALQTLTEIKGVVPILHTTPGCGIQNYLAGKAGGGNTGYLKGYSVPCSNVYEKQVIFGGTSRLREQIKNTVKVINGNLYVTISGCEAEMVGDDIVSMTQEIIDQGENAIYYKAAGFRGNQFTGYVGILDALLNQISHNTDENKIEKGLVTIFGILPKQDIYWQGNLKELERILNNIGLKANTLFGSGQDIAQWKDIPKAELNVVVSKWGLSAAKKAEEKFGTPYLYVKEPLLGEEAVGHFLLELGEKLGIDPFIIKTYHEKEKEHFIHALEQITEYYYEYGFQKTAAIVGDESTVIRYAAFLTRYLGMEVEIAIITDFSEEENREEAIKHLGKYVNRVYFSKDSNEIDEILENSNVELLFGSGLENSTAGKLDIPNYIISYPAYGKVIIDRSDIGYSGAITLLEEVSNLLIKS
ncbi:oxalate:formate antiporter [Anaerocolumna sedimenticola]|uniref:Oxalate:formate antiporter n=1 Tax=Anaerocolumna sedimenticola TaxID=2696063 RepID=A0A6P1TIQ5_9FIRM|nr:nitrogenase component 1 [Anaerocolumna sedimenticola]QHQ59989.1 oxalate:formate antiporter [Anaerocolumna sedimenticola]